MEGTLKIKCPECGKFGEPYARTERNSDGTEYIGASFIRGCEHEFNPYLTEVWLSGQGEQGDESRDEV